MEECGTSEAEQVVVIIKNSDGDIITLYSSAALSDKLGLVGFVHECIKAQVHQVDRETSEG